METLSEKILGASAGEYIDRHIDIAYCHDGTGIQAKIVYDAMGSPPIVHPESIYVIYDHIAPANTSLTADLQGELRRFALSSGMHLYEIGSGICHQVMAEGIVTPGLCVIGADSHSCTLGAFGAFATGVGASDMAGIWVSGETWLRVPDTCGIFLSGKLPEFTDIKDIALSYVNNLGMDGANYRAIEFLGDAVPDIQMEGRLTLSNMAVETGAKTGLFYPDEITLRYLAEFGRSDFSLIQPMDAVDYIDERYIDLSDLVPLLAVPHRVDNVSPVSDYAGTPLDQVFIGTCTNGRYEDLSHAASILKGGAVKVRTIIVPASRAEFLRIIQTGVMQTLVSAGCVICPPGCGPCLGAHMGTLGDGEVGLSTANRNFKNRMGVGASYYLASPTTAAASALTGEITDPRDLS